MEEGEVDIAVMGSTPLAGLLAGLLAERHGRKVALVGAANARYQLPRGIDVSVAPVTRPETWALLRDNRKDVLKLLARIGGKTVVRRIDPIFLAESEAGKDALGHMQVMAALSGEAVEHLPDSHILPGAAAFRLRDAALIERPALEPALTAWLTKIGVRRDCTKAGLTVLADDEAILAQADKSMPLTATPMTVLLTEPTPPLVAPVLYCLDRSLTLAQATGGSVAALAPGQPQKVLAQAGAVLARDRIVRRAGQAAFVALGAGDGAPVVGRSGDSGPFIACGLGPAGAFLAPALARFIAGVASEKEADYFLARAPTANRARVADYFAEGAS
jgi:hypothetical protein